MRVYAPTDDPAPRFFRVVVLFLPRLMETIMTMDYSKLAPAAKNMANNPMVGGVDAMLYAVDPWLRSLLVLLFYGMAAVSLDHINCKEPFAIWQMAFSLLKYGLSGRKPDRPFINRSGRRNVSAFPHFFIVLLVIIELYHSLCCSSAGTSEFKNSSLSVAIMTSWRTLCEARSLTFCLKQPMCVTAFAVRQGLHGVYGMGKAGGGEFKSLCYSGITLDRSMVQSSRMFTFK